MESKKKGRSSTIRKFIEKTCNYILPLILLVAYVAVAAGVYYAVEKDCETHVSCPAYYLILEEANLHIDSYKIKSTTSPSSSSVSTATVRSNGSTVLNVNYEELEIDKAHVEITKHRVYENRSAISTWFNLTYWSAFHFMAISVTTIGYGDIYPCTDVGQFLTVVSCVLGIPMTLITVARLCRLCEFMYHLLWAAIFRSYKKQNLTERDERLLARKYYVPMWIGLPVPACWLLISSVYFYTMLVPYYNDQDSGGKPFTYFTSFYFTMISFLTIGFGDYAPVNYALCLPTFVFILCGLSLVTMGANSVQAHMELMYVDRMERYQAEYARIMNGEQQGRFWSVAVRQERAQELQDKQNNSFVLKVLAPFAGRTVQQQLLHNRHQTDNLISTGCQASLDTYEQGIQANLDVPVDEQRMDVASVGKRNVKFQVRLDWAMRRSDVEDVGAGRSRKTKVSASRHSTIRYGRKNTFKSKSSRYNVSI